jgi:phage/plasmid-associated DNA primase
MTEPSELSGSLNRALSGLHRLFLNEGFTESVTIRESLDDYKKQNDTVAAFVLDCCEFNPEAEIKRTELYISYVKYCEDGNYDPTTRNKCYDRIRIYPQVGEKKKDGIDYFTGIGLNLKWKSGS